MSNEYVYGWLHLLKISAENNDSGNYSDMYEGFDRWRILNLRSPKKEPMPLFTYNKFDDYWYSLDDRDFHPAITAITHELNKARVAGHALTSLNKDDPVQADLIITIMPVGTRDVYYISPYHTVSYDDMINLPDYGLYRIKHNGLLIKLTQFDQSKSYSHPLTYKEYENV